MLRSALVWPHLLDIHFRIYLKHAACMPAETSAMAHSVRIVVMPGIMLFV